MSKNLLDECALTRLPEAEAVTLEEHSLLLQWSGSKLRSMGRYALLAFNSALDCAPDHFVLSTIPGRGYSADTLTQLHDAVPLDALLPHRVAHLLEIIAVDRLPVPALHFRHHTPPVAFDLHVDL